MQDSPFDSLKEQTYEESRREEEQLRAILPKSGFFSKYLRYTDRQESPGSFHFWTAATVLGATLQRRAWISKGIYEVYPNLYTILVAPTGRCRKSRAIDLGYGLVERFDWLNVIADKTTPEQLLADLEGGAVEQNDPNNITTNLNIDLDSTGMIKSSELSTFLNRSTYSNGMVTLLTDLYDCPRVFRYRLRNHNNVTLSNVALSFLGASTPEWLATNIPEAAFEGGFMSRVIFVVKFQRDRHAPIPEDPLPGEKDDLVRDLMRIRKTFKGRIDLGKSAKDWYIKWYEKVSDMSTGDSQTDGFIERKPDTLFKVAMLLSAAEDPTKKIVNIDHMRKAKSIVDWTQDRMFRAFQDVDLSHVGMLRKKVIDLLLTAPGNKMSRREVLRKLGGRLSGVKELEEVEKIMDEAEEIEVGYDGSGKGRPSKSYKLIRGGN